MLVMWGLRRGHIWFGDIFAPRIGISLGNDNGQCNDNCEHLGVLVVVQVPEATRSCA